MIDFRPLLAQPKMVLLGAAGQFGIFGTLILATLMGFPINEAASIGVIGACGISAFPMAGRLSARMAQEEDFDNFIVDARHGLKYGRTVGLGYCRRRIAGTGSTDDVICSFGHNT